MKLPRLISKWTASEWFARLFGPAAFGGWLAGWLGNEGERLAARYLRRQGYKILARRYRTALGELDLVARDGACIVFVEVKTRRSTVAGQPHEAVDRAKQAQLTRLALAFLKRYRRLEQPARFDVVSIIWDGQADDGVEGRIEGRAGVGQVREPQIVHYRNAFEPPGRGQMFS